MSEWQPEETAPRNGKPFLALDDDGDYWLLCFRRGDDDTDDCFVEYTNRHPISPYYFTHWMPLPEPPK